MVKLTEKKSGKSHVSKHCSFLPAEINWNSKKLPAELTSSVSVIYRLSLTSLIGTCFEPLKLKVYFPGDMYDKGVWSVFKTSNSGISWRDTAVVMAL